MLHPTFLPNSHAYKRSFYFYSVWIPLSPSYWLLTCTIVSQGALYIFGQGKEQIFLIFLFIYGEHCLRLFPPLLTSLLTLLLLRKPSELYSFPLTNCSEGIGKENVILTWHDRKIVKIALEATNTCIADGQQWKFVVISFHFFSP